MINLYLKLTFCGHDQKSPPFLFFSWLSNPFKLFWKKRWSYLRLLGHSFELLFTQTDEAQKVLFFKHASVCFHENQRLQIVCFHLLQKGEIQLQQSKIPYLLLLSSLFVAFCCFCCCYFFCLFIYLCIQYGFRTRFNILGEFTIVSVCFFVCLFFCFVLSIFFVSVLFCFVLF